MSPHPRLRFISWLMLGVLSSAAIPAAAQQLDCQRDPREAGVEALLIQRLAKGVVSRVDAHRLRIKTAVGPIELADEPPHDEPFSGVHHQFCDRRNGLVLLRAQDGVDFTGKLVNESTGAVTPAGESVLLSPDGRAYLANIQPDGMDGLEWEVRAIDGRLSWRGNNFVTELPDGPIKAYLEQPAWTAKGELTAVARCTADIDRTYPVKLVRRGTVWAWVPGPSKGCPAGQKR